MSRRLGEAVLRGGEAIVVAGDPISEPFRPHFDPVSAPFRNLSIAPGIRDDHSELAKLSQKVHTRSGKNPARKIFNNETFAHTQSSAQPPRSFQKT